MMPPPPSILPPVLGYWAGCAAGAGHGHGHGPDRVPGTIPVVVVVLVDLETSPFFFLSLDDDEDEDFGFVASLLPPPDELFVEVVPFEVVTFVADEESVPVEDERAGPSSDFARSTDISRPCSSQRVPGVRELVTTFAPITLPYLEKICFRSVARVSEDSRDTHRLRPTLAAVPLLPPSELAFDFSSAPAAPPTGVDGRSRRHLFASGSC
uniref:Uncharacterized protein n=1 Tax=Anopheles maculatus TaxID=74869 RepID=A0A182SCX4_9DIPT